jgi:serine/threonine-protein kinase
MMEAPGMGKWLALFRATAEHAMARDEAFLTEVPALLESSWMEAAAAIIDIRNPFIHGEVHVSSREAKDFLDKLREPLREVLSGVQFLRQYSLGIAQGLRSTGGGFAYVWYASRGLEETCEPLGLRGGAAPVDGLPLLVDVRRGVGLCVAPWVKWTLSSGDRAMHFMWLDSIERGSGAAHFRHPVLRQYDAGGGFTDPSDAEGNEVPVGEYLERRTEWPHRLDLALEPASRASLDASPLPPLDERFKVIGKLGEGGMGTVWDVMDTALDRRCALKSLRMENVRTPATLRRLVREGQTLAKLRDPGIVEVYDVGLGPDHAPYLLMELVDGEDLSQRLVRQGPLSLDEAAALMADILGTVQVIHDAGIVHRDIKPSNFMLSSRGVRVVDFGIALSTEGTRLTRTIDRMGTPDFMAPEQWTGEATRRSDLFAAGRLLFTLVAGHPPKGPDDRPSKVADVPATVDDVYAKATATDPADRYASAHEMAVALEAALEIARRSEREPVPGQAHLLAPARIADVMDRVQRSYPMPIAQAFAQVPVRLESGGNGSLFWNLFRAVEDALRYLCATHLVQLQEPDERYAEILEEVVSTPRFGSWTALAVRGETLLRRSDRILPRTLFGRLDAIVQIRNEVAHSATTPQDGQARAQVLSVVAELLEDLAFLEQEPLFIAHVAPWGSGETAEPPGALRAMGATPRAWKVERVEVKDGGAYISSGGKMVRLYPFCLPGPTLHDLVVFAGGLPRTDGRFQFASSHRMSTDELNDRSIAADLREALRRLGLQRGG